MRHASLPLLALAAACSSEESMVRVSATCSAREGSSVHEVPFGERVKVRTSGFGPFKKSQVIDSTGAVLGTADAGCLAALPPAVNQRWVKPSSTVMRTHEEAKNVTYPWGTVLAVATIPGDQALVVASGIPMGLVPTAALADAEPTPSSYLEWLGKLEPAALGAELVVAPAAVVDDTRFLEGLPRILRLVRQAGKGDAAAPFFKRLKTRAFDSDELRREICAITGPIPVDPLPLDCAFTGARVVTGGPEDGKCPEPGKLQGEPVTVGEDFVIWACLEGAGLHVYASDASRTWIAIEVPGGSIEGEKPTVTELHALPGKGTCALVSAGPAEAKAGADHTTTLLCGSAPGDDGKIGSLRYVTGWSTLGASGEEEKVNTGIGWPADEAGFLCLGKVMAAPRPDAGAAISTLGFRAQAGRFEKVDAESCD